MSDDMQLIHNGKLIQLYKEKVELNGGGHQYFDIVKHPGGAVIAAIDAQNRLCLLQQWRHAVGQTIWELPAGCLEPGEDPLTTAQRELAEETGVSAQQWRSHGELIVSPGFTDEILYLYEARELTAGQQNLDAAEQLECHWVELNEVDNMVKDGRINDAKTLAVLLRLKLA